MTLSQSLQAATASLQSQLAAGQAAQAAVSADLLLSGLAAVDGSALGNEARTLRGLLAREETREEASRLVHSLGRACLEKSGPDAYLTSQALSSRGLDLTLAGAHPLPDLNDIAENGPWGRRIFEKAKRGFRSPLRWVQDRVFDEMMRDPALKKRMIAFLDVSTGVPPQDLPGFLREYFPKESLPSSGLLNLLLRVGRASWLPKGLVSFGIQAGLKSMAGRFLAGETVKEAVSAASRLPAGINTTLDVVWENVVSEKEADQYQATVMELMDAWGKEPLDRAVTAGGVPVRHISVKLSALTSRFEPVAGDQVMAQAGARLLAIFQKAKALKEAGRPVLINVDLEERQVRDLTYRVVWETLNHASLKGWDEVGVVCQAYLKDSESVLIQLIDAAKRSEKKIQIRIVKGAYHQYEQIVAARKGWDVPVFLSPEETDRNFQRMVRLALLNHDKIRVAVGSHNLLDVALTQNLRESLGISVAMVEQQFLMGVGDHLGQATASFGIPTRFYGPFGDRRKAIGYQMRRLDEVTPDSAIGQTRVSGDWDGYVSARRRRWAAKKRATAPEPASSDAFRNEPEANFADGRVRLAMQQALDAKAGAEPARVVPLIGSEAIPFDPEHAFASVNPAAKNESVALVAPATPAQVEHSVAVAWDGFSQWSHFTPEARFQSLRRAAQIVRDRRYEIAADIVREAGKPWSAALADVEEGIDFLEAYARDGLWEAPRRAPLGVGVAVSPFNYPFAIAMGEMAGGLALGNAMILKPAAQTTLIGRHVVQALRDGGVPPEAVQLVPGSGSVVGQALIESPGVDFVVFTGSKDTADRIIQTAADHPPRSGLPKIVVAETGGKNPIIIDESADLDVAVQAILAGAFGMTGQRCSATSRVIVVESRVEDLVERLIEGARSLVVGDPQHPSTQVGPLIDEAAMRKVLEYIGIGKAGAKLRYAGPTPVGAEGFFVGPHIFTDVDPKSRLGQEEIFGPVLAVMTARDFDDALRIANDVPFGLTAALISRHPGHIRRFLDEIEAGVAYVNRAQIGARVVEQPFGGGKDSGTGPKAGGPHYVARFGKPRHPGYPSRIEAATIVYDESARKLRKPHVTNDLPGEINEEAHDWPLGTGLIWTEGETKASALAAAKAALLMGNDIILPDSEMGRAVRDNLLGLDFGQERVALVSGSREDLLKRPDLAFLVAHGRGAAAVARDFVRAGKDLPGFRRFIGVTDDPTDPGYLSRFANSRTRSERTLRHGADLDLRRRVGL